MGRKGRIRAINRGRPLAKSNDETFLRLLKCYEKTNNMNFWTYFFLKKEQILLQNNYYLLSVIFFDLTIAQTRITTYTKKFSENF